MTGKISTKSAWISLTNGQNCMVKGSPDDILCDVEDLNSRHASKFIEVEEIRNNADPKTYIRKNAIVSIGEVIEM
ncbi:hypothetical protein OZX69_02865 [Lactobacillus sp. ESL0731]|uniref:hypothetical protein n=1 Tax=unclassified Lactobacillus TaxID=2620435 RepID=UPI0023F6711B|nr:MULTISPECIES: hypothetical protein [unclassified Lactobacillus]WEV51651.1 hypothetical protein OZX63_02865 [Lactobacillus sp. ESL0700]WEV62780.1 hypothetical protein OZX69_02865 [Lactobacillus sp. ESL0731]